MFKMFSWVNDKIQLPYKITNKQFLKLIKKHNFEYENTECVECYSKLCRGKYILLRNNRVITICLYDSELGCIEKKFNDGSYDVLHFSGRNITIDDIDNFINN